MRFSLRTIFLLTTGLALWLTRELLFVRGRTATFNYAVAEGAEVDVGGPPNNLVRRMLGDLTLNRIVISREHSSPKLEAWVRRYFPEAEISYR
jgi:hypothetical protein